MEGVGIGVVVEEVVVVAPPGPKVRWRTLPFEMQELNPTGPKPLSLLLHVSRQNPTLA